MASVLQRGFSGEARGWGGTHNEGDVMNKRTAAVAAVAAAAIVVGGAGVATAGADDDATDQPIQGSALQKAEDAALAETGEGKVTETEVGDEESLYEVEVTLDNGDEVDVQLDENFDVVGTKTDSAPTNDD
jgi:uncharacterized membrane protein YkoI